MESLSLDEFIALILVLDCDNLIAFGLVRTDIFFNGEGDDSIDFNYLLFIK